jgi:adenylate kinase
MSSTVAPEVARRSERLARRALAFALDQDLPAGGAAHLLAELAYRDATTLKEARVCLLVSASSGPITNRAAAALALALRNVQTANSIQPRLVLLGRPGAGKGTQGGRLAAHLGVPHVSIGEALRSEADRRTRLGCQAQAFMDNGRLVPDALIFELVAARLSEAEADSCGFILDGFPRTLSQAEALERLCPEPLTAAIELVIRSETSAVRLHHRARPDDATGTLLRRIAEYEGEARAVGRWYEQRRVLVRIDGDRPPNLIAAELLRTIDRIIRRAPNKTGAVLDIPFPKEAMSVRTEPGG